MNQVSQAVKQWHEQQNAKKERTAEDVYWKYVERVGHEACADRVVDYFDRETIAELLLEHLDPDDLDEFLHDNLAESEQVETESHDWKSEGF